MTWTVEDRDKAIITTDTTKTDVHCGTCKYRSMDKTGCDMWCCDVEDNNTCYKYERKVSIFTFRI